MGSPPEGPGSDLSRVEGPRLDVDGKPHWWIEEGRSSVRTRIPDVGCQVGPDERSSPVHRVGCLPDGVG